MYNKLKKYYGSDAPDNSGMNISELEKIAEEIRIILVGDKGISISEYVKRASKIPMTELGHRRIYSVKNEPKMEVFFPSEIWQILKKRCDEVKSSRLTKEDLGFLNENRGRGYQWLSEKLYMSKKNISRRSIQLGISVNPKYFYFSPESIKFIKKHLHMGTKWISDKLGCRYDSVMFKCKNLGLNIKVKDSHYFTVEEDDFIRQNADKGSKWISEKLNIKIRSIVDRAGRIGVKLAIIHNDSVIKCFTPEEDSFILNNMDKGYKWIAEKLNRKMGSVISRAKYKKWKFPKASIHKYTKEEDDYIIQNKNKGAEYLSEKINVSPYSIQKHVYRKLGLRISCIPSKNISKPKNEP